MTPDGLRYTKDHEWAKQDGDIVVVGITDYAQGELGDVVFVELPAVGRKVAAGESFGTIEAVKTVSELYAPLAGEVVAVNGDIAGEPGVVNASPYDKGWMIKLRPAAASDYDALLDAKAYVALLENH
jgi:glycine cleavage system H protein